MDTRMYTTLATILTALSLTNNPHVLSTQWYAYSVTAWSDGSLDITQAQPLTPARALQLSKGIATDDNDTTDKLTRQIKALRSEVNRLSAAVRPDAPPSTSTAATIAVPTKSEGAAGNVTVADDGRCHAIASSTGDRCKKVSLTGTGYCGQHGAISQSITK